VPARATFEHVLAIFREESAPGLIVSALERLGQVEWSQGDLPTARKHLEEAGHLTQSTGNAYDITIAESNLAELSVDEGHYDGAIAALNSVLTDYRKENQTPTDLNAPTQYLAEAFLALNKPDEARKALETLRDKKGELPNSILAADYQLTLAQLGDPKPCISAVQKLLADKTFTDYESRLEVRLILAKVELKAGRTAEARDELTRLKNEADGKGYGLWSGKAGAVLKTIKA